MTPMIMRNAKMITDTATIDAMAQAGVPLSSLELTGSAKEYMYMLV